MVTFSVVSYKATVIYTENRTVVGKIKRNLSMRIPFEAQLGSVTCYVEWRMSNWFCDEKKLFDRQNFFVVMGSQNIGRFPIIYIDFIRLSYSSGLGSARRKFQLLKLIL